MQCICSDHLQWSLANEAIASRSRAAEGHCEDTHITGVEMEANREKLSEGRHGGTSYPLALEGLLEKGLQHELAPGFQVD